LQKKSGVEGSRRRQNRPLFFGSLVILAVLLGLILSACSFEIGGLNLGANKPNAVIINIGRVETPTVVLAPTATPSPTATATPSPTATATATPSPTATATPTPSPTATPYPTATPLPTTTPVPFEAALMDRSATTMGQLSTLHFILEIRQGKVVLNGTELKRAEGDLKTPNNYQAAVRVKILFGEVTFKLFAQNGEQEMTDPISGHWFKSGSADTLNLAGMLDPRSGIAPVLKDLQDLRLVGSELLNNTTVYHIQGIASPAQAGQLTFHNLGQHEATIDAWIGQDDGLLRQLYLKEAAPGNGFWTLSFSGFNQAVEIKK
jgi:hypothetical protein